MPDVPREQQPDLSYTADDLRTAVRLVDPAANLPDEFYERAIAAPPDSPYLMPFRLLVALTVVSERLGRAADAWLAEAPPEERVEFERERDLLRRVARGEASRSGWGP